MCAELGKTHVQCCHLDQGDFSSVCEFGEIVKQWSGEHGVDVLVNNAAIGSGTVHDYVREEKSEEDVKLENAEQKALRDLAFMRVNALGPLWVTEAILPLMQRAEPKAEEVAVASAAETTSTPAGAFFSEPLFETTAGIGAVGSAAAGSGYDADRRVVLFIGSVGGGSLVAFPEFDAPDLMSKAAVIELLLTCV